MAEDMFVIAIIVVGALILLFVNMNAIKRYEVREGGIGLPEIVAEAAEKGYAEGVVSYPDSVCLDVLIDFEFPCRNEKGIFAKVPYCFEGGKEYLIKVKRNDAGGVCIEAEEVER